METGVHAKTDLKSHICFVSGEWPAQKKWESADGKYVTMLLAVPKECMYNLPRVLEDVRGETSGAHLGARKTGKSTLTIVHC